MGPRGRADSYSGAGLRENQTKERAS
jgi:hypothetical protein